MAVSPQAFDATPGGMTWLPYAAPASFFYMLYSLSSDDIFSRAFGTVSFAFLVCLFVGWSIPPSPFTPVFRFLAWFLGFLFYLLTPFSTIFWCLYGLINPRPLSSPDPERMKCLHEIPRSQTHLPHSDVVEYVCLCVSFSDSDQPQAEADRDIS